MVHPDDIKNAVRIVEALSSGECYINHYECGDFSIETKLHYYEGKSITACLIAAGLMEREVDDGH